MNEANNMVDWSKAPEGATHWGPKTAKDEDDSNWVEAFYKMNNVGVWQYWNEDDWYGDMAINDDWHQRLCSLTPHPSSVERIAAHEFLERGVSHMRNRAVQRDSEAGERSMARAVAAFNAQEGTNLTEAQGWRFMIQLKYARAVNGVFVADDYEDMAAYAGLAGEAAQ
jgi:hypothetical protein